MVIPADLPMEDLLDIKKIVDDLIKERKEAEKQKAFEEVKSLLERVNTLQEEYDIKIGAYDEIEGCRTSVSDFLVHV